MSVFLQHEGRHNKHKDGGNQNIVQMITTHKEDGTVVLLQVWSVSAKYECFQPSKCFTHLPSTHHARNHLPHATWGSVSCFRTFQLAGARNQSSDPLITELTRRSLTYKPKSSTGSKSWNQFYKGAQIKMFPGCWVHWLKPKRKPCLLWVSVAHTGNIR